MGDVYADANDATRQLAIFYLFNDVLQKEKSAFAKAGLLFLQRAQVAYREADVPAETVLSYLKTISLWRTRNVYARADCQMLLSWFLHPKYMPEPTEDDLQNARNVARQKVDFRVAAGVFHVLKLMAGGSLADPETLPPEWNVKEWRPELGKTCGAALALTREAAESMALSEVYSEEQLENVPVSQLHQLKLLLMETREFVTEEMELLTLLLLNMQNLSARNRQCIMSIAEEAKNEPEKSSEEPLVAVMARPL